MNELNFYKEELSNKSSEVTTSLHCFGECGFSALRSIIREHIENLDMWHSALASILTKLESALSDTQDFYREQALESENPWDYFIPEIGEAVEEVLRYIHIPIKETTKKGEVIRYNYFDCIEFPNEILSIFNEYLETYKCE